MVKSHFTGIQSAILEELKQARFSIKVAVAWFTSDTLFEALCRRAEEGLDVQLILSNSINEYDKGDYYARRLKASGGELFRHGASDFKCFSPLIAQTRLPIKNRNFDHGRAKNYWLYSKSCG
ncbi:MAG: hypothetical protein RIC19_00545 [Phaeodactylibacter sp.]|uniref:hypothetical protein n=1 Tax=Phaeodactylibacter sp. TaxID=1940289 RepID=UPI0032EF1C13